MFSAYGDFVMENADLDGWIIQKVEQKTLISAEGTPTISVDAKGKKTCACSGRKTHDPPRQEYNSVFYEAFKVKNQPGGWTGVSDAHSGTKFERSNRCTAGTATVKKTVVFYGQLGKDSECPPGFEKREGTNDPTDAGTCSASSAPANFSNLATVSSLTAKWGTEAKWDCSSEDGSNFHGKTSVRWLQ